MCFCTHSLSSSSSSLPPGDLWIASNECTTQGCAELAKFSTSDSKSFQTSKTPFSVQYGSGATKGHLASDTVTLAGYTVDHQSFALATELADGTLQAPASGLMGLGLQQLSSAGVTPFWEVLAKQNVLSQPVFSIQLARNTHPSTPTAQVPGGIFTLGELDSKQYSGDINWIDLDSGMERVGYWGIPVQGLQHNNGNTVNMDGRTAIPDSGTSLIGAPSDVVTSFYQSIEGSQSYGDSSEGMYAFPCSTSVTATFTMGGQKYTVAADDFNAGAVTRDGSYCLGALFSMDTSQGMPNFILGDSLMKSYFTAFRLGTGSSNASQVGFASLKSGNDAQTLKTTATYVTATSASGVDSSAGGQASSSAYSGGLPPLTSAGNPAATGTQIYYGQGLSSPVASGGHVSQQGVSKSSPASRVHLPSVKVWVAMASGLLGAAVAAAGVSLA